MWADGMTPEALIARYRDEQARIHGHEYVEKLYLVYDRGWFRLRIAAAYRGYVACRKSRICPPAPASRA